ncbi:MAG: cytochrome c [Gemmatimonadota bacterium]|nr:cytochrome c [Gemmatimonadota bacterium]
MKRSPMALLYAGFLCVLCLAAASACRQDMHDQPRAEPFEESDFFGDRRSVRPAVEGTIARGHLRLDEHFYTGKIDGALATTFPSTVTIEMLKRGQERYDIYCAPCHSKTGDGLGMIVQRGMKQPESFHSQRLLDVEVGHYFDVVTNGFGTMYSYEERIDPADRWAIAAYIRALQMSQGANLAELPESDQQRIQQIVEVEE